jgi:IS4 transposase
MRFVVVWDSANKREIALLTNHLDFGAATIAAVYKDRCEIDIFFKALKTEPESITFIDTSENTLLIQIWKALIAMLILK